MERETARFSRRGFTLLELMVVVLVIGVLFSLALPALVAARDRAGELACLARGRSCYFAVQTYADSNRDLPPVAWPLVSSHIPSPLRVRIYSGTGGWIETDYFNSRSWCYVVMAADPQDSNAFLCAGVRDDTDRSHPYIRGIGSEMYMHGYRLLMSTFSLSDSYRASPRYFTPDSPQLISDLGPQRLTLTAFPSSKALLYESFVFHRSNSSRRTLDLDPPAAPVALADGSARVIDFRTASEPVNNRFRPSTNPHPMSNTLDGVRGRDF